MTIDKRLYRVTLLVIALTAWFIITFVSYWFAIGCVPIDTKDGRQLILELSGGQIGVMSMCDPNRNYDSRIYFDRVYPNNGMSLGFEVDLNVTTGEGWVIIPLWTLCPVIIVFIMRIKFRESKNECCIKCGYDLQGCIDKGCPECGWNREVEE